MGTATIANAGEPRPADRLSTIGMGARIGASAGVTNDDAQAMPILAASPAMVETMVAETPASSQCESDHFRVRLNAVCPMEPEATDLTFFEEAKKPTLSVEFSSGRKEDPDSQRYLASLAPSFSVRPPIMKTWVVATMDLLSETLFGEVLSKEFSLNYPDRNEKNEGQAGVSKTERVVISVCDDKNGNGKCSDEEPTHQLTVRNPSYPPCGMPKVVSVTVWAGCPR